MEHLDPSSLEASAVAIRDRFMLARDVVFLNHGSFGACPRPVFEEHVRWLREMEAQPVAFFRRSKDLLAEARRALGTYLGAGPDDLVFVSNATTGLNVVAKSLRLSPGDEVLATDHEYGALDRTWRFYCDRWRATYVRAPIPLPVASKQQIVEAVWSHVTPRTRVLFLSHITAPTALIMPVEELVRRARAAGILTVIDGAHAPGQIPVDLTAVGADFYAGNCHKWMCAPKGTAFLYARREAQALLEPLVISWGWQADQPGPSRFIDEQEWQGTRDIAAFLAVPTAIAFLKANDWGSVRRACHSLLTATRAEVNGVTGQPPICPDGAGWFGQMASVVLPPCNAEEFAARLREEFRIEVPVWQRNDRQIMRISIQGYNTQADAAALVAAVSAVVRDQARPALPSHQS